MQSNKLSPACGTASWWGHWCLDGQDLGATEELPLKRSRVQLLYDILPSPSNLFRWDFAQNSLCPLCQRAGPLEQILSCCSKALGDERHDQVLRVITEAIFSGIATSKRQHPTRQSIAFFMGEASVALESSRRAAGNSPGMAA